MTDFRKRISKLTEILTIPLAVGISGCENSHYSVYEGNNIEINKGNPWTYLYMRDEKGNYFEAKDTSDFNGVNFDTIDLSNLPAGHPFEKYANPQSLREIYQHVMEKAESEEKVKAEAEE